MLSQIQVALTTLEIFNPMQVETRQKTLKEHLYPCSITSQPNDANSFRRCKQKLYAKRHIFLQYLNTFEIFVMPPKTSPFQPMLDCANLRAFILRFIVKLSLLSLTSILMSIFQTKKRTAFRCCKIYRSNSTHFTCGQRLKALRQLFLES